MFFKLPAKSPEQSTSVETPKMPPVDEYIEAVVCNTADLKDNEMKSLEMGPGGAKVLVIKQDGQISAIGAKCTHYGAPLVGGALGKGRVRCPWHGACFNTKTGDIEDFPGLDSLPCYQVNVADDGSVKVRINYLYFESEYVITYWQASLSGFLTEVTDCK